MEMPLANGDDEGTATAGGTRVGLGADTLAACATGAVVTGAAAAATCGDGTVVAFVDICVNRCRT